VNKFARPPRLIVYKAITLAPPRIRRKQKIFLALGRTGRRPRASEPLPAVEAARIVPVGQESAFWPPEAPNRIKNRINRSTEVNRINKKPSQVVAK
jgi:hypothetical protein